MPASFTASSVRYGGLGVITEVTLDLVDNVRVKRQHREMPITEYKRYFLDHVRGSPSAIFHNADIYPDDYTQVEAITFWSTSDPVTIQDRLIAVDQSYRGNRFLFWLISEWPFGNAIRRRIGDPIRFAGEPVTWRNYEASYDVAELEPSSRADSTYVLEEYFVPIERFDDFVMLMRDALRRHHAHVINISIRHATQDPGRSWQGPARRYSHSSSTINREPRTRRETRWRFGRESQLMRR